jgi:hypothetical protein
MNASVGDQRHIATVAAVPTGGATLWNMRLSAPGNSAVSPIASFGVEGDFVNKRHGALRLAEA